GYTIDQAMLLCDQLIIAEGSQFVSFPNIPERSNDGTLDIMADKMRAYPNSIRLLDTIREHRNYRFNQAANFNRALGFCDIGDYFIKLDADEFYFDGFIGKMNDMMDEGEMDCLKANALAFAFSFKWSFNTHKRQIICKKTSGLHFVPTSRPVGYGPNIIKIDGINVHHYTFVKPRERVRMRMATSGMYRGMLKWFDANWDTMELGNGKPFNYIDKSYVFKRYDSGHPSVLDNHPWRYIEDIRREC
ncbi:unnamed protein product, partial [marine sediment metagenome]